MPSFSETQNLVRHCLNARMPLIMIQSIEPTRVMSLITEHAGHIRVLMFFEHSLSDGIRELLTRQLHSKDTSLALAMEQARSTFKSRANVNLIFTNMEDLNQGSSILRCSAKLVRLIESRRGTITLISSLPMWMGLPRLGISVALELSNKDEMRLVVTGMIDNH